MDLASVTIRLPFDHSAEGIVLGRFIETPIDAAQLIDPSKPLVMIHIHDLRVRPMKVVRQIGYLLEQLFQRVA